MIIGHLHGRHFRNYQHLDVSFPPGLVLLSGSNGQGKTSLLEAIYYLALLRSFRTVQLRSLRQWSYNYFYLGADLVNPESGAVMRRLNATFAERRRLRIDGCKLDRSSAFIHKFTCLSFVPEDIQLSKGASAYRRRFLDILISQYDQRYLPRLQQYNQALKSRNAMLREPQRYGSAALRAFDQVLIESGSAVTQARIACVLQLQQELDHLESRLLPSEVAPLEVRYSSRLTISSASVPDLDSIEQQFGKSLVGSFDGDCRQGLTRIGPHRDEINLSLRGRSVPIYASEGQCRVVSLALRLASLEILLRQAPADRGVVLLIDDVLGELDSERKAAFFAAVGRADQLFLAVTDVPAELKQVPAGHFRVAAGSLHVISNKR